MSSFTAPPGHPSQQAVLIAAAYANTAVSINAPDHDLKAPVLSTDKGEKIDTTKRILKQVAVGTSLLPDGKAVEDLLIKASGLEQAILKWVEPSCQAHDDPTREGAKTSIITILAATEQELSANSYLAGDSVTLADVMMVCLLHPLFSDVLGKELQAAYPFIIKYLAACCSLPEFAKVLGSFTLCDKEGGWQSPAAQASKKDKKKKKGGKEDGEVKDEEMAEADNKPQNGEDMDPEKLAKKLAKQAEKEAKKAKAAAKAAAAAAAAEAKDGSANEKKAKLKAEAEAKKQAEAEEVAALIAAAASTPAGGMKDVSGSMYKAYHPKIVEAAWYSWWEECGFFKPDVNSDKPPFVIVIPPPNVTGALHIGHALTNSIQDTIVRWRRMLGYNTVWVPGTDHAGIATQTVVEKKIQREEGLRRHDLGREKFLERVWEWVGQYGDRICDQLRRLGSSVDWERKAFTMDENLSRAVLEAFVRMHESGIIYRDNRLVNWCCRLKTAVSDIEVDYIDIPKRTLMSVPGYTELVEFGVLTSFAYKLDDESGDEVVVATTRPETMLGDTAVAIHPEDERYKRFHGKFVVHPVDGRRIPIICDSELVDMAFGTGCVKVTPAHDPNDFATGKRHNLQFINIFDDNGCINDNGGPFKGQPRFQTRVEIVKYLTEKGLFRGTADNAMRLGLCSRSKDVIEPVLKPQWWVNCKDMAARSCQAVRDGDLEIVPKEFEAVWFRWLENIRDWCISRQLWWGHRIPAYYVQLDGESDDQSGRPGAPSEKSDRWVIGRTPAEAQATAEARYPGRKVTLHQDEDVLDTWFSSGLFPFSVFQWPQQSLDLEKFYPGALLETGHDILFFWVARMVMMGLQLTDKVPFKQVYLHAMVRDAHGRKMSKSLGNVIDPLHVIEGISLEGLHQTLLGGNLEDKEVEKAKSGQKADFPDGIEECGTDALRFALVAYTSQARDINLDIKRVVAYRYWCNKLWNAIKFAMMNFPADFIPAEELANVSAFPAASQWILSRLNNTITSVNKAMELYDFSTATQRLYAFWQYDVCDVFIEVMKPVMHRDDSEPGAKEAKQATRETLWTCLETGLRLLHPFMPFVTEELWQRLPKTPDMKLTQYKSIMIAPYPTPIAAWDNAKLESDMEFVNTVINRTRALRSDYGLTKQKPHLYINCTDEDKSAVLQTFVLEIATLTTSADVSVLAPGSAAPAGCSVAIVDDRTTLHMLLKGILDPSLEIQKLEKKSTEVRGRIETIHKKIAMPAYTEKTPENIKAEDQEKLGKSEAELANVIQAIADMKLLLESQ